jgi:hypothetical protein
MRLRFTVGRLLFGLASLLGLNEASVSLAEATPYPVMAPLTRYFEASKTEEIALARSAAPTSISANADVLILGRDGYKTTIKGTNGFVCLVERSWATTALPRVLSFHVILKELGGCSQGSPGPK